MLFTTSCKAQQIEESSIQVVLLAGQSNMAGAGDFDELEDSEIKRIEKISARVSLSFNGKPAKPLSYYKNKPSEKYHFLKRFGPEIFIGLELAEANPNKHYLLIKRSQGGTALYGAWNPEWTEEKAKEVEKVHKQKIKLYSMHIADIKENLELLEKKGKSCKIIGMAWFQGENDAVKKVAADSYDENLTKLINAYRSEFNIPKMPFVIGQTNSRYGIKGGAAIVRKAMEKVAKSVEHVDIIKTTTDTTWNDFPKHSDNVHYNAEGQKRFGIAFGKKLMNLIEN